MNINVGIDLPLGLGSHRQRVDFLYRATTPLIAYINPWGGDHVLVIRDGHILGVVQRDKRPIWTKLQERIALYRRKQPAEASADQMPGDPSLADCCA
jgi:hypothetical protein